MRIPENVTIISDDFYAEHVETRIWGYNKPTILLFYVDDPEAYLSQIVMNTISEKILELGLNEIPIYGIDVQKCPKTKSEFHIDRKRLPMAVIWVSTYINERYEFYGLAGLEKAVHFIEDNQSSIKENL